MSFEFNDLNAQIDLDYQICRRPTYIACFYRAPITWPCRCLSRPAITIPCICVSKPVITVRFPYEELECGYSVLHQVTDITRQVGNPAEFDVLRRELDTAIKQLDVQREAFERSSAPQSDEAFVTAEATLKQQLETLQRQREEFRKGGGGKPK